MDAAGRRSANRANAAQNLCLFPSLVKTPTPRGGSAGCRPALGGHEPALRLARYLVRHNRTPNISSTWIRLQGRVRRMSVYLFQGQPIDAPIMTFMLNCQAKKSYNVSLDFGSGVFCYLMPVDRICGFWLLCVVMIPGLGKFFQKPVHGLDHVVSIRSS